MAATDVAKWLDTLRKNDELRFQLVDLVRQTVLKIDKGVTEEIKYGGILFSKSQAFCGVFSYTNHVTLEFGNGAELPDVHRVLEGKGKGRRHIKIVASEDLSQKHVKHYIELAFRDSLE